MFTIRPLYFFLSFAIGLFFVYVMTPPAEIILKFPSPYNAGKVTYRDKANACYRYKAESVVCAHKDAQILPQPVLEDFKGDVSASSPHSTTYGEYL